MPPRSGHIFMIMDDGLVWAATAKASKGLANTPAIILVIDSELIFWFDLRISHYEMITLRSYLLLIIFILSQEQHIGHHMLPPFLATPATFWPHSFVLLVSASLAERVVSLDILKEDDSGNVTQLPEY